MPDRAAGWSLAGFLDRLDAWAEQEKPPDDVVLLATGWIMTRYDDPYQDVRREPGFDDLWFGPVPNTEDGVGQVVACSYWIVERSRTVVCSSFATLDLPV